MPMPPVNVPFQLLKNPHSLNLEIKLSPDNYFQCVLPQIGCAQGVPSLKKYLTPRRFLTNWKALALLYITDALDAQPASHKALSLC